MTHPMALSHPAAIPTQAPVDLVASTEALGVRLIRQLDPQKRRELGQFMTPGPVAGLMASMIHGTPPTLRLLDAGAGVGALTAAAVSELLTRSDHPTSIQVTAFEVDPTMIVGLRQTLSLCFQACEGAGIKFKAEIREEDFLLRAADWLSGSASVPLKHPRFDLAIQNPPYKKLHSASDARRLMRSLGVEATNLYTAFLAVTLGLLAEGGQLVSISPRSFCSGSYFRPFRELLFDSLELRRIHLFLSRDRAFKHDAVLQETVIISAAKGGPEGLSVQISSSQDAQSPIATRMVPLGEVVRANDQERYAHIRSVEKCEDAAARLACLPCTLADLGINVSTGRVVDFRAREHLRSEPDPGTVPLIYPGHIVKGLIEWPRPIRKPNALHLNELTSRLTVPTGPFVLAKRFSTTEEHRRVVAALFDPEIAPTDRVGFENHLNYFHRSGAPLDFKTARGLAIYLNSTLVDECFRQFNGHTQVNATDLRSLRYPSSRELARIGESFHRVMPEQGDIDELVNELIK